MSSITFPYGAGHASSSSFISVQESTASSHLSASSSDPPNDTSSFQMNPLSSHPPRTPRTSLMSNGSHVFGTDVYDTKEDAQVTHSFEIEVDESESEDGEKAESGRARVRREDVWRELLKSANGRDKAFVRIYSCFVLGPVLREACSGSLLADQSSTSLYLRVSRFFHMPCSSDVAMGVSVRPTCFTACCTVRWRWSWYLTSIAHDHRNCCNTR